MLPPRQLDNESQLFERDNVGKCGCCHETTACAAQLEHLGSVMRVQPVSNEQVFQGYRPGILEGFATLLLMKGQMGFVCGGA